MAGIIGFGQHMYAYAAAAYHGLGPYAFANHQACDSMHISIGETLILFKTCAHTALCMSFCKCVGTII